MEDDVTSLYLCVLPEAAPAGELVMEWVDSGAENLTLHCHLSAPEASRPDPRIFHPSDLVIAQQIADMSDLMIVQQLEGSLMQVRLGRMSFVPGPPTRPAEVEMRLAALHDHEHQYQAALAARLKERERANNRAKVLLYRLLTPEQRQQMGSHGWFLVHGSEGGWYTINPMHLTGNVLQVARHEKNDLIMLVANLCANVRDWVPHYDHIVAQLLWLQGDEAGFRRIANISHYGSNSHCPHSYAVALDKLLPPRPTAKKAGELLSDGATGSA